MIVGDGDLRYELVENWAEIPAGWELKDVAGVAVDADDRVYLHTRSEHAVVVLERDGTLVGTWGQDFVVRAHGISIADGYAYLADLTTHTVRKCTLNGKVVMTLGTENKGSDTGYIQSHPANLTTITRAAGPFNRPAKAVVAPNGDIYVADGYGNARIHRFSADGKLLQSWGEPGEEPGQFNCPHGIWVHTDDRVYVCDRENDRVQIFSLVGELLEIWPDLPFASDICIDADNLVYLGQLDTEKGKMSAAGKIATESRPSQVSVRDLSGTLLTSWGGVDRFVPGNFVAAHDLVVDSHGDIYVGEVTFTALSPRVTGLPDSLYKPEYKVIQKFARVR